MNSADNKDAGLRKFAMETKLAIEQLLHSKDKLYDELIFSVKARKRVYGRKKIVIETFTFGAVLPPKYLPRGAHVAALLRTEDRVFVYTLRENESGVAPVLCAMIGIEDIEEMRLWNPETDSQ